MADLLTAGEGWETRPGGRFLAEVTAGPGRGYSPVHQLVSSPRCCAIARRVAALGPLVMAWPSWLIGDVAEVAAATRW